MRTKAQELLPDELLQAIQVYIQGETLYIPMKDQRHKWGSRSGNRAYYEQRNKQIRMDFTRGKSLMHLSECYCLSVETIKKIVYKKM
ncbi:CD3324 family protein [Gracilibacillus caseinilyticus]|uniref:CD3324 family protein n=1 Tax=Gracilibacillus caseinilyticus TaxID=2932256 RepID=A0ABY4EXD3_9BACI|nr:CD3324 family protein [Gracilibacillus caseinilyticus]UOQ49072.1 CD3324 family protein [Gracilibacillus caseinilyticus]